MMTKTITTFTTTTLQAPRMHAPTRRTHASRAARVVTRVVDTQVAYAVAQQNVGFALCVALDALSSQESIPSGTPGRPNLAFVLPACGALVGSFALIQSDGDATTPAGLALGTLTCLALLKQYVDRFDQTPRNEREWPGPRLMPTIGILFSIFALLANVEAIPKILNPLVV